MGCLGGGASGDKVQQQKNKEIERQIDKERQRYKATHRLLLLVKEPGESAMRNETRKRESVRALTADTLAWTSSRLATATTLVVCRLSSGVQVSGCTEALSSHFFGDALQCLYLTYLGSTLVMFLMGW
ncbi:hypothetical protein LSAT2_028567 [Lamellibrachia satsuma]|nr:hypothetical protein LSAT2_028567 [Lamellibrachia satsuma]